MQRNALPICFQESLAVSCFPIGLIDGPCFGIVDNALLSICKPDFVHRVVDRKLMPSEEIRKMEALKEDDNPVILKCYLKR